MMELRKYKQHDMHTGQKQVKCGGFTHEVNFNLESNVKSRVTSGRQ